ncbi:MAG: ferrous iron transport protein B [Bacteroidia bacterium]
MNNTLKVALIGNPNTGKSSLFNALTGLRQKVGNFPGITVDKSTGFFNLPDGRTAELTDLPGTYSLFPKSIDEAVPLDVLLDKNHPQHPELILYIADASNLKRNLVLLTQIIDLKIPVILVLNMIDQAAAKGVHIDTACMQEALGVPVVTVNARKRKGIEKVADQIQQGGKISESSFLDESLLQRVLLKEVIAAGQENTGEIGTYNQLLRWQQASISETKNSKRQGFDEFRKVYNFDSGEYQRGDLLYRYRAVNKILTKCVNEEINSAFKKRQQKLDAVLTHKVGGYVIFFLILFVIFQAIFHWAQLPMEMIENGFSWLSNQIGHRMDDGILKDLITDGILAGLSGVVIFIPQIAFLFFFITLMEDTGYLARVAFLMDRTMRRFGLNGKSVIPLISGTACAVPAIMSARNIENARARLITILVTPLMSCSARLPVYILLIGIAVPDKNIYGILSLQGLVLMGMYLLGFLAVIGGAAFFRLFLKTKEKQYFILELPVYRLPNWQNVGMAVYTKVRTFISEAGKIIIAIAIILWFLASFGPPGKLDKISAEYDAKIAQSISEQKHIWEQEKRTAMLENSFAGILGKSIEPAIRPLGFDWKIGIALITSFAAREVFVGTMSTLYGLEDAGDETTTLRENMMKSVDAETVRKIYSFATVVSLMLFYAFALQCMSTLAITYKETASLKWTVVQFTFMGALAYFSSLIAYQLLK